MANRIQDEASTLTGKGARDAVLAFRATLSEMKPRPGALGLACKLLQEHGDHARVALRRGPMGETEWKADKHLIGAGLTDWHEEEPA